MRIPSCKRRNGLSELIGSILVLAMTIVAGAAVFSYVNTTAGVTEMQYGQSVAGTVNFLQERFVVFDLNFTSSKVTIWIYNNGKVAFSPVQVLVYNMSRSQYLMYNATKIVSYRPTSCTVSASTSLESPLLYNPKSKQGLSIPIGSVQTITLTLPSCASTSFKSGKTYVVSILGLYGNSVTYYQTR